MIHVGVIVAVPGSHSVYQNRLSAMSLLSKFLWNPVYGAHAANMTRRFLPEPVVILLKNRVGNASLQVSYLKPVIHIASSMNEYS